MFTTYGPVDPESGDFVGRETELRQISRWLEDTRCVGTVLGARQTGKTSLLLQSRHLLRERFAFVFIDLEALVGANLADCYRYIAQELIDQIPGSTLPGSTLPESNAQFLHFLRLLSQTNLFGRVAILLDEVGALEGEVATRLAHTIRAVFTDRMVKREYQRYVFVLAGSVDLLALTTGNNSPLKNVCESLYVPDLSPGESSSLLQRELAALHPTPAALDQVYAWTNGHPYLTQLIGSKLAAWNEPPTESFVDQMAWQVVREEDRNLPYVRRMLDRLGAPSRSLLASLIQGKAVSFTRYDAHIAEMEMAGIIAEHAGQCRIRNRVYEELLNQSLHHEGGATPGSLLDLVMAHFSMEGLVDVCFRLNIDHENIGGKTKDVRARELILYCRRNGRLPELVAQLREMQPLVMWPDDVV